MSEPQPSPSPATPPDRPDGAPAPLRADPWLERAHSALIEKKASNVLLLDIHHLTDIADHFLIASGLSDRHVRALADAVQETLDQEGRRPAFVSGYDGGHWILLDYIDAVIHIFDADTREHYRLERLWSQAATISHTP